MSGLFIIVPQPFADDVCRHLPVLRYAGPAMARHIEINGAFNSSRKPILFKPRPICLALSLYCLRSFMSQYRKIGSRYSELSSLYLSTISCISSSHRIVSRCPVFFPAVCQNSILEVALFQVCHINKRHAPGIETEKENIPCQLQLGFE